MKFEEFVGQKKIKDRVSNLISEKRFPHAVILLGPEGSGKSKLSRIIASNILCEESSDGESCGECNNCKMFQSNTHPDLYIVMPEKETIGVDEIREMQKHMQIKPLYSEKKVYIIENDMTTQSQNSMLKTMEEPPYFASIIINTDNISKLLETICSRAMLLRFVRNSPDEIKDYLVKNHNIKNAEIDFIIKYSDGIIGRAEELIGEGEIVKYREIALKVVREATNLNKSNLLGLVRELVEVKEDIETVIRLLIVCMRDLILIKRDSSKENLLNIDKLAELEKIASRKSVDGWIRCLNTVLETEAVLKRNANYQLAVESMLIKIQEDI